jgi:HSP90 family molecular chaperone
LVKGLAAAAESGGDPAENAELLFDLALVAEGAPPKDPVKFAERVASLMADKLK